MEEAQAMRQRIEEYLVGRFPDREELSVGEVESIGGGMSYLHLWFTVHWREAQGLVSEDLIIRVEPETGLVPPYDIRPQYEIFRRLYRTEVSVPKVYWLEEDSKVLGRPFILMEKIKGERLSDAWAKQPEHRGQYLHDYTSLLSKMHGLDWQDLGLSFLGAPEDYRQSAEKRIARWEKVLEDYQYTPYPIMTELCSWLKRNIPPAERLSLCHGDYYGNNCFTRNGRVVSVFDWEMADIGDPVSDVSYACYDALAKSKNSISV